MQFELDEEKTFKILLDMQTCMFSQTSNLSFCNSRLKTCPKDDDDDDNFDDKLAGIAGITCITLKMMI